MAKKEDKKKSSSNNKSDLSTSDKIAKTFLSMLDSNYSEKRVLDSKNQKYQDIVTRELKLINQSSNGNIIDLMVHLNKQEKKDRKKDDQAYSDFEKIFTDESASLLQHYKDLTNNRYLQMNEYRFISKFIPSLGHAVKFTLSAITNADDLEDGLHREFVFDGLSDEERTQVLEALEKEEKNLKLLRKLRNVYKETLISGSYAVYKISYDELFNKYKTIKESKKDLSSLNTSKIGIATESANYTDTDIEDTASKLQSLFDINDTKFKSEFKEILPNITINSQFGITLEAISEMQTLDSFGSITTDYNGAMESFKEFQGDFDPSGDSKPSIAGTYIKLYRMNNCIPVQVFGRTIGYYIIDTSKKSSKKNNTTRFGSITDILNQNSGVDDRKQQEASTRIVDLISDTILNAFDTKFIVDHAEYKDIIADCIVANGLVNSDIDVQFIPAEYIDIFSVNRDVDDNGHSILENAFFYANILLTLISSRMLNYVNNTGNTTIAHVHKGRIGKHSSNRVNRMVEDMQSGMINFNDFLKPASGLNKLSRFKKIALPTFDNGGKVVEYETMEGAQIEMNPQYEESLKQEMIIATDVPGVLMENLNGLEFAKQIESANIRFAGAVALDQSDLEEPTTSLYKSLIRNSGLSNELKNKALTGFKVVLPRPKTLRALNSTEMLETAERNADSIINVVEPENENDPATKLIRTKLKGEVMKEMVPLNWDKIEDKRDKLRAEFKSKSNDKDDVAV